jgi:hypothetical protein
MSVYFDEFTNGKAAPTAEIRFSLGKSQLILASNDFVWRSNQSDN